MFDSTVVSPAGITYTLLRVIGQGSYGTVYVATRSSSSNAPQERICLKHIPLPPQEDASSKTSMIDLESSLLSSLQHAHIIKHIDSFLLRDDYYIATEYADGGDLESLIAQQASLGVPLPEDVIMRYFLQLLSALTYLHSQGILHRDVKSANVFLANDRRDVKLGDFGIATRSSAMGASLVGTPQYLPPEQKSSLKSDTWALGCVLYEMSMLKKPFESSTLPGLMVKIATHKPPLPPRGKYSDAVRQLLLQMLDKDDARRPTCAELSKVECVLEWSYRLGLKPRPRAKDIKVEIFLPHGRKAEPSLTDAAEDTELNRGTEEQQQQLETVQPPEPSTRTSMNGNGNVADKKRDDVGSESSESSERRKEGSSSSVSVAELERMRAECDRALGVDFMVIYRYWSGEVSEDAVRDKLRNPWALQVKRLRDLEQQLYGH